MNSPFVMIWRNGELRPHESQDVPEVPKLHETIEAYETGKGTFLFQLKDRLTRLRDEAGRAGLVFPYSLEVVAAACRDVVSFNSWPSAEIRAGVYASGGETQVVVTADRRDLRRPYDELLREGTLDAVELWPPPEYAEPVA